MTLSLIHIFRIGRVGAQLLPRPVLKTALHLGLVPPGLPSSLGVHEQKDVYKRQVLLLVKNELVDDVSVRVEDFGVFVLGKPLSRPLFYQALKLAQSAHKRMMGLRQENQRLQNRIEEIRRIDRAKCVLIQSLGMTEDLSLIHISATSRLE